MSVEVHGTAEISLSPHEERIRAQKNTAVYARREMHARVPTERYARRMTVNLPHLVHQSVSHHY